MASAVKEALFAATAALFHRGTSGLGLKVIDWADMLESTALAMDRLRVMKERIRTREEANQERYRGNLLRAISHDLRTPLAGIMGTSEMIMDMTVKDDARFSLAEGIYKDADWLHSLVENILSLTRLQDGRLTLNKQPEAVEEVIGAAVLTIGKRAPEREIAVQIPDDLLMVPMDARLIGQVRLFFRRRQQRFRLRGLQHQHALPEYQHWPRDDLRAVCPNDSHCCHCGQHGSEETGCRKRRYPLHLQCHVRVPADSDCADYRRAELLPGAVPRPHRRIHPDAWASLKGRCFLCAASGKPE